MCGDDIDSFQAWAIREGTWLAIENNWEDIEIELDSSNAINIICRNILSDYKSNISIIGRSLASLRIFNSWVDTLGASLGISFRDRLTIAQTGSQNMLDWECG